MVQDVEVVPGRRDRSAQDRRPLGLAAHQGQHRRRPHDHRGKSARQSGKDRRKCRYIDALEPAEAPAKGPGLYYMDSSSAAAECVTLMAAGGYVVHTFPTGQGNVIGNPIVPVIKISGNPKTLRTMGEHIDV